MILAMRTATQTFKALADETRLRILSLLRQGELCVCDLMAVLQLPQSTISRHLAVLRNAGWVIDRRQGIWMYYHLADDGVPLRLAMQHSILAHLAESRTAREDQERLGLYLTQKASNACGEAQASKTPRTRNQKRSNQ